MSILSRSTEDKFLAWRAAIAAQDKVWEAEAEITLYKALWRYAGAIVYEVTGVYSDYLPDLVEEIVTRGFTQSHKWNGDSLFITWFYKVGVNACRDWLRAKRRRLECSLEAELDIEDSGPLSQALSDASFLLTSLEKGLTSMERTLLREKIRGSSSEEIAQRLRQNQPPGETPKWTIRLVHSRWKRLKKRLLKQHGESLLRVRP